MSGQAAAGPSSTYLAAAARDDFEFPVFYSYPPYFT